MAEFSNSLKPVGGKYTNYRNGDDPNQLLYGKVLPQAIPLEEAVLGAIMLDKDGFPSIIEILRQEMFYYPAHQEIFLMTVSYTHLRAHETVLDLVCRLLLEQNKCSYVSLHCCVDIVLV